MKGHMTSSSLVRVFGAALLVNFAAGCGTSSPAGSAARRGRREAGRRGRRRVGRRGRRRVRAAGTTGGGGTTGGRRDRLGRGDWRRRYHASGVGGSGTGDATGTGGTGGGKIPDRQRAVQRRQGQRRRRQDRLRRSRMRRPARQRRELVRDRHPGRQHGRVQAGLLLRRQLGRGRRRLRLAAQVRSAERQREVPVRRSIRDITYDGVLGRRRRSRSRASTSAASSFRTAATASAAALVPGAPTPIKLASTCTAADFGNPAKCPTCTQVTQCSNPCERCEICIGKPTIPADCAPPDGGHRRPAAAHVRQRLPGLRAGHEHARRRLPDGPGLHHRLLLPDQPVTPRNAFLRPIQPATGRSTPAS